MNANVFAPGVNGFTANNREDYRSEMNSAELNWRHWLTPELSVIAGFRYLNWHENLNAAFDTVSPLPPGSVNQVYHTSNNLFGFQTGGDWKHWFNDKFGIELGAKVGVYGTHTEMDGTLGIPGIGALPTSAASSRASFVGELGLIGTYKLTTYLNVRAGYQVMWVEGIALAPDQENAANFLSAPSVNNRGGVFLHGAVLGSGTAMVIAIPGRAPVAEAPCGRLNEDRLFSVQSLHPSHGCVRWSDIHAAFIPRPRIVPFRRPICRRPGKAAARAPDHGRVLACALDVFPHRLKDTTNLTDTKNYVFRGKVINASARTRRSASATTSNTCASPAPGSASR